VLRLNKNRKKGNLSFAGIPCRDHHERSEVVILICTHPLPLSISYRGVSYSDKLIITSTEENLLSKGAEVK
jgi:hypothetical protein